MPMEEEKHLDRVQKIPLTELVPFKDHPLRGFVMMGDGHFATRLFYLSSPAVMTGSPY